MNKGGLQKKIIKGFLLFQVLVVIYSGFMVGCGIYGYKMKEYKDSIYRYLKSASEFIDGDKIENYIATGKTDQYYDEVLAYLDSTRMGTDIITFCVFVPREDDLVYVWMSNDDESSYDWLNKVENYMKNGKETRDLTFRKNPVEEVSKYKYGGKTILAGFYPIFDSEGEPVALIDIDLSFPQTIYAILLIITAFVVGVLLITVCAGRVLYVYFDGILIKPISTLNNEARHMIENLDNEDAVMRGVHTGDELEELSESFAQMNVDVRKYIKENLAIAAEKERIGADLQLASKIQLDMLPQKEEIIQKIKGYNLSASMQPAKEVGGDFYDFYMLDDTHLVILIADVSDKGAAAALFMAISKTLIKSRAGMGGSAIDIISYVDKMISEKNNEGMFVTVWFAIIDLETGHVDACNAGHDYPAILKHDEDFVIEKTVHGPPIGFIPGAQYEAYDFTLEPGDKIFLYTDGVNESKGPDGDRFGLDRLLDVLNANKDLSNDELVEKVKEAVKDFAGSEPQFDDMTMLLFTVDNNYE